MIYQKNKIKNQGRWQVETEMTPLVHHTLTQGFNAAPLLCKNPFWGEGHRFGLVPSATMKLPKGPGLLSVPANSHVPFEFQF